MIINACQGTNAYMLAQFFPALALHTFAGSLSRLERPARELPSQTSRMLT